MSKLAARFAKGLTAAVSALGIIVVSSVVPAGIARWISVAIAVANVIGVTLFPNYVPPADTSTDESKTDA